MLLVILILVIAAVCGVLGVVIKGLLWLALIGLALLIVSAVLGAGHYRNRT